MPTTRTPIVILLAAGGLLCAGGCYITPTDVKPAVVAHALAEEGKPAAESAPATEAQPEAIEQVVAVPFLYDTWEAEKPKIEWLPARRLAHGESVPYPLRIHASPILRPDRWLSQGMLLFAPDCWPVACTQNSRGGPSQWDSPFVLWLVLGARGTVRAAFYRSSHPFGDDVYRAGLCECTDLILAEHLPAVFQAVDESRALGPADRVMAYKALLAWLEEAWKGQDDSARQKLYVGARQALREKITLVNVPQK